MISTIFKLYEQELSLAEVFRRTCKKCDCSSQKKDPQTHIPQRQQKKGAVGTVALETRFDYLSPINLGEDDEDTEKGKRRRQ